MEVLSLYIRKLNQDVQEMVLSKRWFGFLDQVLCDIKILLLILDHDGVKELLHTVRVPLAYGKLLRHLLIFIKQLNSFMN